MTLDLVRKAGVRYDAHFNYTTVDPPEVVRFIQANYPDVEFIRPRETMYAMIVRRGPPNRLMRWCCAELKECGGTNRTTVTGIRAEESQSRAYRHETEDDRTLAKQYVHPIFMWSKNDIWQYINEQHLPYCSLYDEGWERIGCVGCPMGGNKQREQQFVRWPGMERAYRAAIGKWLERRSLDREIPWKTIDEAFDWWMEREAKT